MYIFISEDEILQYNGEILKRYVGDKCVKTISNPTDEDLLEFGYKPLIDAEIPEYDEETQYIERKYIDNEDNIQVVYTVKDYE